MKKNSSLLPPWHRDQHFLGIAHRGFSSIAPENTIAAFRNAIDAGADMIEFDVTLTQDGHLIVFHDKRLKRTTDGKGLVRKKKLAEIQSLDAGSWFADAYRYERVPTLEAALQFIQKKALMNIEIKKEGVSQRVSGGIEEKIIDRVTQHGLASHVLISSFSALAVSRCKRLAPEIPNALLLSRVPRAFPRKTIEKVEPHGIHVPKEGLSRRWVEMCKKNDLPLRVYTVNSKGQMEKLKRWGVSGIFTDRIDLLMGC